MKADLILFNACVLTLDPSLPTAELVAVRNKKIFFIGKNEKLGELKDSRTRVIDCGNSLVLPGFIDRIAT